MDACGECVRVGRRRTIDLNRGRFHEHLNIDCSSTSREYRPFQTFTCDVLREGITYASVNVNRLFQRIQTTISSKTSIFSLGPITKSHETNGIFKTIFNALPNELNAVFYIYFHLSLSITRNRATGPRTVVEFHFTFDDR